MVYTKLRGAATETTVYRACIRGQTLFLPNSFAHNVDAAVALAVVARLSHSSTYAYCPFLPLVALEEIESSVLKAFAIWLTLLTTRATLYHISAMLSAPSKENTYSKGS